MTRTPRSFNRRRFLSFGAAGGMLGWPLLSSLSARAADDHPLRLLLVFTPNGTIQEAFWPTLGATPGDFTLGPITAPFEAYKERLLFLKGLSISVSEVGPGGPHQKGIGGLFTNHQLQQGTFVDGDGARAGYADGISVDQEIARHIGEQTPLPSLELGVRAIEADVRARISYFGPGNPAPPVNEPLLAYERLFAGMFDVDDVLRAERRSVIDVVHRQYAAIAPQLSLVDRQKLEQHQELVRSIERRMGTALDAGVCARPTTPPQLDGDSEDTMQEIAAQHNRLLAGAFACDLTRVASLQFSSAINEIRCPWIDSMTSGHTLSHAGPGNTAATEESITRARWYASQVADLMSELDAIPEGDGSVLDHTLIVWGNELGLGNAHTHDDIPFLLAGGANGKLRMGRLVDYGGKSHAGLLVSLLNLMGVPASRFGHPDYADGPLPDLT